MSPNHNSFSIRMIFVYILAFFVLREWLVPLPVITDTGNLNVFLLFTGFCFVIMFFQLRYYISIPIIILLIIYGIHRIFFEGPFYPEGITTAQWLMSEVTQEIFLLLEFNISSTSFEFRSFLFFVILAIVSYLIHYWVHQVNRIFLFLLATLIYITVLDTFTLYDAKVAIIRFAVIGSLLIVLLFKEKLEKREGVQTRGLGLPWYNLVIFIIGLAALSAFHLPKYDPHWPDPVPTMRAVVNGEQGGASTKTIGYSENDERLGGGIKQNDQLVFTAISKQKHYWRGESKEVYTGKGWTSLQKEENKTFLYSDKYLKDNAIELYDPTVTSDLLDVQISMVDGQSFSHFFYPGQLVSVDDVEFIEEPGEWQFVLDYVSGKVSSIQGNNNPISLQTYKITYQDPQFAINKLERTPQSDPEYIEDVYLQLPDSLPERVGNLSSKITEEFDNRYDKVKAIETYFSKNQFSYQLEDVAIPTKSQDYVDQFLFETKEGYCDNFSTSMVVMLRTIDIPARWVKGFTAGNLVERLDDGYQKYEITNENAHSWVEVYFDDVGWVPFEPTKGFSQNVNFVEEEEEKEETQTPERSDNEREEQAKENNRENPFIPQGVELNSPIASTKDSKTSLPIEFISIKYLFIIFISLVCSALLYRKRKRLISLLFIFLYKNTNKQYNKGYERLLWLLQFNGLRRLETETLREYSIRVDRLLNSSDFSHLTLEYEASFYGNISNQSQWKKNKQMWLSIVNKISS